MGREFHVRFREGLGVQFPQATRLVRKEEVERAARDAHRAAERLSVDQGYKASQAVAWMAEAIADTPRLLHREDRLTPADTFAGQWQAAKHAVFYALMVWSAVKWSASAYQLKAERAAQGLLLRDVYGNPFRPVTLDPAWGTPEVLLMAQSLYEERRFEDMPVLADALEEAGCQDAAVLEHCRVPGPHVRGCWVLDLLLGKGLCNVIQESGNLAKLGSYLYSLICHVRNYVAKPWGRSEPGSIDRAG
jgi:hypothetical protein